MKREEAVSPLFFHAWTALPALAGKNGAILELYQEA